MTTYQEASFCEMRLAFTVAITYTLIKYYMKLSSPFEGSYKDLLLMLRNQINFERSKRTTRSLVEVFSYDIIFINDIYIEDIYLAHGIRYFKKEFKPRFRNNNMIYEGYSLFKNLEVPKTVNYRVESTNDLFNLKEFDGDKIMFEQIIPKNCKKYTSNNLFFNIIIY